MAIFPKSAGKVVSKTENFCLEFCKTKGSYLSGGGFFFFPASHLSIQKKKRSSVAFIEIHISDTTNCIRIHEIPYKYGLFLDPLTYLSLSPTMGKTVGEQAVATAHVDKTLSALSNSFRRYFQLCQKELSYRITLLRTRFSVPS